MMIVDLAVSPLFAHYFSLFRDCRLMLLQEVFQ